MAEELNAQELEQFKQMESQESEEKVIIEAEKAAPIEPQIEEETPSQPVEEKKVSLAALQEERERRKVAEASARQAELNQARLDERLRVINERLNPAAAPREAPDPEKDAMGALKANTEEIKAFREFQDRQVAAEQRQEQARSIAARASADEAEYMKDNPDYGEASVFLKSSRAQELAYLGMNPLAIQQTLTNEALQLAQAAIQQGKNPAKIIHDLAKTRGFKQTTQVVQAQPEGDAEKLAKIAAGQKANMSLGNLNSTPSKPQINGKDLLAMDDAAFETWLEKLPVKERAKYLGA